MPDVAPRHVEQITALAKSSAYDGIVFHRVIDGFMAQTGDVQFGKADGNTSMAGMGGSDLPDLPAGVSATPYLRGIVGMARSQDRDGAEFPVLHHVRPRRGPELGNIPSSAMLIAGMDVVDAIQRGEPPATPDRMEKVTVED